MVGRVLHSYFRKIEKHTTIRNRFMNVVNENGDRFELRIDGYMSEYKPDKYFENNWLRGEIVLSNNSINERINLHFLQVEELVKLEEWLNRIGNCDKDKETSTIFDFIDPDMRFRIWKRGHVKTVRFLYHSETKEIYSWELILNEKNVTDFKGQLEKLLIRFPIR